MLWSAAATNIAFAPPAPEVAEPAQRATELARRRGLQGEAPSRPTLGPSALAGPRLAAAMAGLRKASELFAQSCTIYSRNEPSYMESFWIALALERPSN